MGTQPTTQLMRYARMVCIRLANVGIERTPIQCVEFSKRTARQLKPDEAPYIELVTRITRRNAIDDACFDLLIRDIADEEKVLDQHFRGLDT